MKFCNLLIKFCRRLAMLLAIPLAILIIWRGGIYLRWQVVDLVYRYDRVPAQWIQPADASPESRRVARLEAEISHLGDRLGQITTGIAWLDFWAGPHEKEQLATAMIALYTEIIDQSTWPNQSWLTTYYIGRAATYSTIGDYEKGLRDLNTALSIKPGDSITLKNRAVTYQAMGRFAEALQDYEQFLKDTKATAKQWQFHREFAQQQLAELHQRVDKPQ